MTRIEPGGHPTSRIRVRPASISAFATVRIRADCADCADYADRADRADYSVGHAAIRARMAAARSLASANTAASSKAVITRSRMTHAPLHMTE